MVEQDQAVHGPHLRQVGDEGAVHVRLPKPPRAFVVRAPPPRAQAEHHHQKRRGHVLQRPHQGQPHEPGPEPPRLQDPGKGEEVPLVFVGEDQPALQVQPPGQRHRAPQVGEQELQEAEDHKRLVALSQDLERHRVTRVAQRQPALDSVDGRHQQHPQRVLGEHALLGEPQVVPHVHARDAYRRGHKQRGNSAGPTRKIGTKW
mmetsp:Transcript_4999/g.10511  ORF Transcript_4999/g.10511 Transcript_4999/m.10511 type:complete len:203 (-) Transcript_4999:238-846(-)